MMKICSKRVLSFVFFLIAVAILSASSSPRIFTVAASAESVGIRNVSLSKDTFNPFLQQTVDIQFDLDVAGFLTVLIVDRDGYPVSTIVSNKNVQSGLNQFRWDGRTDNKEIVADEAYSLYINLKTKEKEYRYFPASNESDKSYITLDYYDRQSGILSYKLLTASRVLIQAEADGVTKTVIHAPRTIGSVIDSWDGYDATGKIYIPERAKFRIRVSASPLPESSIICIGNRNNSFEKTVSSRKGKSLLPTTPLVSTGK